MLLCTPLLLAFYAPQDQYAATPLVITCANNHPQVATYLISKGARVDYQNKVLYSLPLLSFITKSLFSHRTAPRLFMQLLTMAT